METKQVPLPAKEPLMDGHDKPDPPELDVKALEVKVHPRRKLEDGLVNPRDGRGPLRRSDSQAH
jgi:hypothetical protein